MDIKPANMEELTEVITAAEFHPHECNLFVYSSSKGTIRLCDMREQALCDKHAKCKSNFNGSIKGNSSRIFFYWLLVHCNSFENYDIGIGYHKFKNIIILVSNV